METISEDYRRLNEQLHDSNPNFGVMGERNVENVLMVVEMAGSTDVLDYGCGKGTLAMNLPFDIREYDPAIKTKADKPFPADIVVCTDVLEHIEPEYIDAVLDDLKRLMRRAGLLTVATRPAKKTLEDGRNAHLIIEPLSWWIAKMEDRFKILVINNNNDEVFGIIVEPKKPNEG